MLCTNCGSDLPAQPPVRKRQGAGGKAAIGVLCAALAALAAAGAALLFWRSAPGGGAGDDPAPVCAYLTDGGELMLLPDLKEKTEALKVAGGWEDQSSDVQFSRDGERVYFLKGDGDGERTDLYCAAVSRLKKGEGADLAVRDVVYFQALDGQNVLFLRFDESDDWRLGLGLYNGEDEEIISSNLEDFTVSQDEKSLYYTEYREDARTLYRMDLAGGEKETLVEGADSFLTDYDAETLIYAVDETRSAAGDLAETENHYAICARRSGQEPEVLVRGTSGFYTDARVENGQIQLQYTTRQLRDATLYDFVTDSASSPADDELRQQLRNSPCTVESYDLYRYVDGASQLYAADIHSIYGQNGVYVYRKNPGRDKVADLSELADLAASEALEDLDSYDYYAPIETALYSGPWYQNFYGKESVFPLPDGVTGIYELYALSDREVVVSAYGDETDYLLSCNLEGDRMTVSSTLDEGWVFSLRVQEAEGKKSLYFISGSGDEAVNLVRYQDGEKTELAKGVSEVWIMEDGETSYVTVREGGRNELVRLKDGQSVTVTDELAGDTMMSPFVISGDNVLYIDQSGRLYVWDGQESRRLAKGVEAVWANGSGVYTQVW